MKYFNTEGSCIPENNYMVDLTSRVEKIEREIVARGKYFTVNRARQYGKTTFLYLLKRRLQEKYIVLSFSFESSEEYFASQTHLAKGLQYELGKRMEECGLSEETISAWKRPFETEFPMKEMDSRITKLCNSCDKGIVLLIDEVDKCSDNQVFLSFLGLLRSKYLDRKQNVGNTFLSVILAGVYDIKNLKLKLLPNEPTRYNSPWNISATLTLDMSFSAREISAMLREYEADHQTGMDVEDVGQSVYDYTSGYPYLVSALCQIMDERLPGEPGFESPAAVWTKRGVAEAEHCLRKSIPLPALFDDLIKNLQSYPKLKKMISEILFSGMRYPFSLAVEEIQLGSQFGFLREKDGAVAISNRIFETFMYDAFVAEMAIDSEDNTIYMAGLKNYNQFVINGQLQMDLVMRRFYDYFQEIYAGSDERFIEEQGRKLFLLYLKPIINGSGNYYIEARTRDMRRTDVIVDYHGTQHIIELKIYHGNEYNKRGEAQLFDYLTFYKKDVGYLLSFNFNKNKETGVKEVRYQGKRILEVVV